MCFRTLSSKTAFRPAKKSSIFSSKASFERSLLKFSKDGTFGIYVFRYAPAQPDSLEIVALRLVGKTAYRKTTYREEASEVTDCLTAVYYVFEKALGYSFTSHFYWRYATFMF